MTTMKHRYASDGFTFPKGYRESKKHSKEVFVLENCELHEGETFIGVFSTVQKAMDAGEERFKDYLSDDPYWTCDKGTYWEVRFKDRVFLWLCIRTIEMNTVVS